MNIIDILTQINTGSTAKSLLEAQDAVNKRLSKIPVSNLNPKSVVGKTTLADMAAKWDKAKHAEWLKLIKARIKMEGEKVFGDGIQISKVNPILPELMAIAKNDNELIALVMKKLSRWAQRKNERSEKKAVSKLTPREQVQKDIEAGGF